MTFLIFCALPVAAASGWFMSEVAWALRPAPLRLSPSFTALAKAMSVCVYSPCLSVSLHFVCVVWLQQHSGHTEQTDSQKNCRPSCCIDCCIAFFNSFLPSPFPHLSIHPNRSASKKAVTLRLQLVQPPSVINPLSCCLWSRVRSKSASQ